MIRPERTAIAPGLEISRILTGLWQVADQERDGKRLDTDRAARELTQYAAAGFDSFDMADHYGSAEEIAGRFLTLAPAGTRPTICTKWCPKPGPMTREVVRAGVERSLKRLGVSRIDLLQFHWWTFDHPGYLDAMRELQALQEQGIIANLGVTNFDADHLRVLLKSGIRLATNQVCYSLLDRRAGEDLSALCAEHGVKLLAYGALGGGFLADRWVGAPQPGEGEIADWSKMKYRRFIEAIGGWSALQAVLGAAATIARKHGVSVANVATRWVLEQPEVAAVIVGVRLGEREHRADNLRLFAFALDAEDRALLERAFSQTKRLPGDCGDEYRRPPFLTASGDLSHHLDSLPRVYQAVAMPGQPGRSRIDSGTVWEPIAGFSRAMRVGERILVSGTTATHSDGSIVCPGDVAGQTVYVLDKIIASIASLGGRREQVVRTRIYLRDARQWEAASRVHGHVFGDVRPANTLVEVSRLVGDYEVEIEAEAVVPG
jgi:aryl-alcohol dehydrogenase-like predicted oxidoreductase/enamine deaminase RidA (YjgF/YER057c/UK114 family)